MLGRNVGWALLEWRIEGKWASHQGFALYHGAINNTAAGAQAQSSSPLLKLTETSLLKLADTHTLNQVGDCSSDTIDARDSLIGIVGKCKEVHKRSIYSASQENVEFLDDSASQDKVVG
ncbi:hypothetical protein Salat_2620600 [Sesamum alatum]|uniref:Uncharacterized protein n=1 Tax=Sesamum alatum TaxID=300844 RepID=A0AAE1XNL6_9LAMI|nr:hypothetical protein Salat_2620600 [Sesamum alatum]